MVDLGTLGGTSSYGYSINASGQVTGSASTAGGISHAFVYSNGVLTDLNDLIPIGLGITLTEARAINDLGQIAANGSVGTSINHSFLLTLPADTPEPGTFALLLAGCCGIGWAIRRRQHSIG